MLFFSHFFHQTLPYPLNDHFHVSIYYYYSIPIINYCFNFLNYFALTFGTESRLRKEALNKMEEIMSKEQNFITWWPAAAAAHSLGTPFSTIKIISSDLLKQFKDDKIKKDIELLVWSD